MLITCLVATGAFVKGAAVGAALMLATRCRSIRRAAEAAR
jgi:hypothetical protein